MRYPSLFTSTATKRDQLLGKIITVVYHPNGGVTSRWEGRSLLQLDDPGMPHFDWIRWMKSHGYSVVTRDATAEEIEEGVAL